MTLDEELEQQFASAEQQSNGSENSIDVEEQPETTTAEVDEWLDAPKSYKKEYQESFKDLPQNWRKHLITREKEIERGFSDFGNRLNAFKYIDDDYNGRQEALKSFGLHSPKETHNFFYRLVDGLNTDPRATIGVLADTFGVDFNANEQGSDDSIRQQLFQMQQSLNAQQQYIEQQKALTAQNDIRAFIEAKGDDGQAKHPYFEDVRADMQALLKGGLASNLDEAYSKAIYMNESVREKIIAGQAKADLQAKANEAQKAKLAGFQPKSKATPVERELTLEEELERNFAKHFNE